MPSDDHDPSIHRCPRCGDGRPPVRSSRLAWAIFPLVWAPLFLVGAGAALLLPLNLILVPCWLACASAVGALARRLLDPRCAACGESRGTGEPMRFGAVARPERVEAKVTSRAA